MSKKNNPVLNDNSFEYEDRISNVLISPKNRVINYQINLNNNHIKENNTNINNLNKISQNNEFNLSNRKILTDYDINTFNLDNSNEPDKQKLLETFLLFKKFVSIQNKENYSQIDEDKNQILKSISVENLNFSNTNFDLENSQQNCIDSVPLKENEKVIEKDNKLEIIKKISLNVKNILNNSEKNLENINQHNVYTSNEYIKDNENILNKNNSKDLFNQNLSHNNENNLDLFPNQEQTKILLDEDNKIKNIIAENGILELNKGNKVEDKEVIKKIENYDDKPIKSSNANFFELLEKTLSENPDLYENKNISENINIKIKLKPKKVNTITQAKDVKNFKNDSNNFYENSNDLSEKYCTTDKNISEKRNLTIRNEKNFSNIINKSIEKKSIKDKNINFDNKNNFNSINAKENHNLKLNSANNPIKSKGKKGKSEKINSLW